MMQAPRAPRTLSRAAFAAGLVCLGLAGAACGSDGSTQGAPVPEPDHTATKSASAPTASQQTPASVQRSPLSGFEAEPPVRVMRQWAAASARDVNAGDRSMSGASRYLTSRAQATFPGYFSSDFGLRYLGPLPFTPISVDTQGAKATVTACTELSGFAMDPSSHLPGGRRIVAQTQTQLIKKAGAWKLNTYKKVDGDCSMVTVKGVPF